MNSKNNQEQDTTAAVDCSKIDAAAPPCSLHDIGLHEQITGIRKIDRKDGESQSDVPSQSELSTYPIDKLAAHLENVQHAAISIFVFNKQKLLLQKRAATKYHSAGLWANTVCSHPRWTENAAECATRRLKDELGWTTALYSGEKIEYHARVGPLFENELVQCFYGLIPEQYAQRSDLFSLTSVFNQKEVCDLKWMTLEEIDLEIKENPRIYSKWFKIYMSKHRDKLEQMLNLSRGIDPAMPGLSQLETTTKYESTV